MKIAILVRILWSAGTQKFAIEETRALSEMGHDVELIFLRKSESGDVYSDLLKGLKYRIITAENRSPFVWFYDFITGIFMENRKGEGRVDYNLIRMFPSIVKDSFDLIICQDQWAGLAGYYTKKKYGTEYEVILHERVNDIPWVGGFKRILVRLALNYQKKVLLNAKKVLAVTIKVAESAESFYKKYNLKVVPNLMGLRELPFRKYSMKDNTIALVSFWSEIKAPDLYIDLFQKLEGYTILMIGNWTSETYKTSYYNKIKEAGVSKKIHFLQNLPETEKNDLISNSKFYVRFGRGEFGMGMGTLEAIEIGVPVIVNKELGISNYLESYKCGLVVDDTSDTNRIVKFIHEHDNQEAYQALQDELRRFVKDHNWAKHCEILIES